MPTRTKITSKTRERLTRDRVVEAALQVMDTEGLDAVTMRRVARELGVEAMSLYNHVHDKEDLLDGVVEQVLGQFRFAEDSGDWVENGRAAAREWRRVLNEHPHVITLFAERNKPVGSVASIAPMEHAMGILRSAGFSPKETAEAFHALGGYIFGFVLMETGQMFGGHAGGDQASPAQMMASLPSLESLPNFAEVFPHLCDGSADEQFEFGLDLLLLGLRAKLNSRA